MVKNVSDPRKIDFVVNGHFAVYFEQHYAVNEKAEFTKISGRNSPVAAEKIVMNHYHTKSYQEYEKKILRGMADNLMKRSIQEFDFHDRNEVFDDGILRYRDERS